MTASTPDFRPGDNVRVGCRDATVRSVGQGWVQVRFDNGFSRCVPTHTVMKG